MRSFGEPRSTKSRIAYFGTSGSEIERTSATSSKNTNRTSQIEATRVAQEPAISLLAKQKPTEKDFLFLTYAMRLISNEQVATKDDGHKQYLQSIYDQVRELGAVKSQYEFSALCERKEKWLSFKKAINREFPLGAMVAPAYSVERLRQTQIDDARKQDANSLIDYLWTQIREKAKAQTADADH